MGGSTTQRKTELLSDLQNEVLFTITNTVFIKVYNLMTISVIIIIIIISNSTWNCTPNRNYDNIYV